VGDRLDLAAELAGHRARVVAEALGERPLEPPAALGIREEAGDPRAQVRSELRRPCPVPRPSWRQRRTSGRVADVVLS
jgi:hypothetical protein